MVIFRAQITPGNRFNNFNWESNVIIKTCQELIKDADLLELSSLCRGVLCCICEIVMIGRRSDYWFPFERNREGKKQIVPMLRIQTHITFGIGEQKFVHIFRCSDK